MLPIAYGGVGVQANIRGNDASIEPVERLRRSAHAKHYEKTLLVLDVSAPAHRRYGRCCLCSKSR
jgi:hypothetical protein